MSPINPDDEQDKEKPQAVRTANIVAARGMLHHGTIQALSLTLYSRRRCHPYCKLAAEINILDPH
jgi:hypothetical protein